MMYQSILAYAKPSLNFLDRESNLSKLFGLEAVHVEFL